MNAPASLIWAFTRARGLWFWEHPVTGFILESLWYLVLVGLMWLVVTVELDGKGQSILTPKTGMRRTTDVVAIAFAGRFVGGRFLCLA
jgi:hypothetical protein